MNELFSFLYSFFFTLVTYAQTIWSFCNVEITIGDITFSLVAVLGTALIVTLITWKIIKEFI